SFILIPKNRVREGGYPTLTSITPFRERRCTSPARTQSAKGTRYHRDPPNGTSSKSPTNSCIGPNSPVPTSRGVTETSTLAANDRTHRWAAHRGGSRSPPRTMRRMCRDLWTHREREDADRTAPGVTRPFPNQRIFGRCEPSSSSERTMSERRPLKAGPYGDCRHPARRSGDEPAACSLRFPPKPPVGR